MDTCDAGSINVFSNSDVRGKYWAVLKYIASHHCGKVGIGWMGYHALEAVCPPGHPKLVRRCVSLGVVFNRGDVILSEGTMWWERRMV